MDVGCVWWCCTFWIPSEIVVFMVQMGQRIHQSIHALEVTILYVCQETENLVISDRYLKASTTGQECNMLEPSSMIRWVCQRSVLSTKEEMQGLIFWREFWILWSWYRNISLKNHNRWWTVDPSQNRSPKQLKYCGSDTTVSWKDHGNGGFRLGGNCAHRLYATQNNNHWGCLCSCALEFKKGQQEKMMKGTRGVLLLYTSYKNQSLPLGTVALRN